MRWHLFWYFKVKNKSYLNLILLNSWSYKEVVKTYNFSLSFYVFLLSFLDTSPLYIPLSSCSSYITEPWHPSCNLVFHHCFWTVSSPLFSTSAHRLDPKFHLITRFFFLNFGPPAPLSSLTVMTKWLSVQFSSVAQLCLTLCNPMNCGTPGLPVHHQLPEFTQIHVHQVDDAIQPSHPLSSLSPPAPNPSQHQGLFQWVNSSHQVAEVLEVFQYFQYLFQ